MQYFQGGYLKRRRTQKVSWNPNDVSMWTLTSICQIYGVPSEQEKKEGWCVLSFISATLTGLRHRANRRQMKHWIGGNLLTVGTQTLNKCLMGDNPLFLFSAFLFLLSWDDLTNQFLFLFCCFSFKYYLIKNYFFRIYIYNLYFYA